MNTKKLILAAVVLAALSGAYCLAEPQDEGAMPPLPPMQGPKMPPMAGGPGMGRGAPDGLMGVIMNKLDLTDQQREKIETIIDENHAKNRAAQRAVEKAHKSLEEAVAADANESTIRNAADAVGKAIGDEAVLKVKTMKDIKAVLTPEQIKKLDEIKVEMKSKPLRPMQDGKDGRKPQGNRPPLRPIGPPPTEPQEE